MGGSIAQGKVGEQREKDGQRQKRNGEEGGGKKGEGGGGGGGDAATAKEVVHPPPGLPSTRHGLVGLALSGGGIRSASFSLGVLQALQAHKILPEVDYLSTVSGGGWIGSCLSALMRTPGQPFPFTASPNNRVLEYLRDRSSALVPSGVGGGLGVVALALRGMLASVVMVLVTMLLPSIGIGIVTTLWALILRFARPLRSPVDYFVFTPTL
nr:patatin-like phospholipase family protein [Deltaproteobacteria bacterium]